LPFTKRFKDQDIAVQTQFMVAEAYFELAKKHRGLKQESLARREIAHGRKMLEEAMRDNPDSKFKAQGDYLLANLSLEFGSLAENVDEKNRNYNEAVTRFTDIITSFPESEYAPKSQYKKALTYEKLGEIDMACEEYVKLSYRYPDNELVAETIARLGQYFMTKGKQIKDSAKDIKDPVDQEKVLIQARETYKTAGRVFGRLGVRFPTHKLAGKCSVLSGQCFILAGEFTDAIVVFDQVIANPDADKDVVAEGLYWKGHANMDMGNPEKGKSYKGKAGEKDPLTEAYRAFKKCTWDYPETKWAKYCRGRLTDPLLARVDNE
jgi:TolA-binding protein